MNPLASTQSTRRVLMLLAALTSLLAILGCGSGGSPAKINPVGFSNSTLTGTYVFSSIGQNSDPLGGFISMAGALVANGSGGITGGTMDIVDTTFGPAIAQQITSGSYSVNSDGRGKATLNSAAGTIVLDFVLSSGSHGLVTEFDGNGTGSGTIDLQTAVPTLGQLAGSYAFSLGGIDSNFNTLATVGALTLDSNGNITAGVQDTNDGGASSFNPTLTGSATAGSGTIPGTVPLGSFIFDFYPIDATHFKVIETDFLSILVGDAFSQTGASIPPGPMVFTMTGGATVPVALGGLVTSDGTGNFTAGLEDINNAGAISQSAFTGTAASGGSVGGRVLVNLSGFTPAIQFAIYPSKGGVLMLETDSLNVLMGTALAQTSQTFAASQNFGFNLSAANAGGFEEDDIAQFNTTSTAFTGVVDINDAAALAPGQRLNGNYTFDSPATGRGTATTTAGGSGFVSFTFYVVNSSTVLLIETDTNQLGAGMFQLQSVPAAAMMQSRLLMVPPAMRGHAAHSLMRHR
jgi:hypothetical protein